MGTNEYDTEFDLQVDAAAKAADYEEGFGVRGCDLSQEGVFWAANLRQSTEEQRSNNRAGEYLRTCAVEAKKTRRGCPS